MGNREYIEAMSAVMDELDQLFDDNFQHHKASIPNWMRVRLEKLERLYNEATEKAA